MRAVCRFVYLYLYSCFFCVLLLLFVGFSISAAFYFLHGSFSFPIEQIERAIAFGVICGTSITLYAIITFLIKND